VNAHRKLSRGGKTKVSVAA